jgi:DNA-binding transcriptional ArsR family regulator
MDVKLQALADSTRRALLRRMWGREVPAGRLAEGFAMSRPAVSQHLRVLRDAGLVRVRRDGTRRLYTAHPDALEDVVQFFEELWDWRLPNLEVPAEAEGGARGTRKVREGRR